MSSSTTTFVPKKVFIVPYRNRAQHKFFFSKYMSFLLEDSDDYEIYFSHQCDNRTFNRGAAKNIGFMAVKEKYPNDYKNITFIFNDVDTIPFNKLFDYETVEGTVKHYYGYKYALGGIVVMKGSDFEVINGYPCFWGWGMEDNCLQKRCIAYGLNIDRSTFYAIGSAQILQLFDGISRIISKKDPWRMQNDTGQDGIRTINGLKYTIDEKSKNLNDNIFTVSNKRIFIINIDTFQPLIPFAADNYTNYDLREPQRKVENPNQQPMNLTNSQPPRNKRVNFVESDWTNIPYYPTKKERREQAMQQLLKRGQSVPPSLVHQIEEDRIKEIKSDAYNSEDNVIVPPPPVYSSIQGIAYAPMNQTRVAYPQNPNYYQQQPYQQAYQQPYQQQRQKPRAQASARIRLGGVY
jgi:hypothetical protein